MDFGSFDDDFFEEENKKKDDREKLEWKPHQAEPGWFIEDCNSAHYDSSSFNVKQYRANYLYFNGQFSEASLHFEELKNIANTSHQQREVYEGYVRSLFRAGELAKSIKELEAFRLCCKSGEHIASYHFLAAEIHHKAGNHKAELENLQKVIRTHPLNPDFWHRAAQCYARLAGRNLNDISLSLPMERGLVWNAAASLIRADLILRLGAGRETSGMLKKKKHQTLIEKLSPIIASLPKGFVSKCHEMMGKDVQNVENQQEDNEFVDLGSSSRAKALESAEQEDNCESDDINWFDKQWFSFFDTINELYYYDAT